MTSDGTGTGTAQYTWDGFGRIATVTPWGGTPTTYVYDAEGHRVEDTTANRLFWYGASGKLLETTDAGTTNHDYIYFDGRRIARHDSSGAVYYLYDDADGSLRTATDASGTQLCWADYYPFGEPVAGTGCSVDNYQFAGLYADATGEDGNYSAAHRRYNYSYYRWLSPDPGGRKVVKLDNPQTWNMYAYALNNPSTLNDPSGLYAHNCGALSNKTCAQRIKQIDRDVARWARSKNGKERTIAKDLGTSKDTNNGVTISFVKNFWNSKGQVIPEKQGDTNGLFAAGQFTAKGRFVPDIQMRLKGSLTGDELAATLIHEGSHAVDRIAFAAGCGLSGCNQSLNLTGRQTEERAYGVEYNYWQSVGLGSEHSYISSQRQIDIFLGLHPEVYTLKYLDNPIFPPNL